MGIIKCVALDDNELDHLIIKNYLKEFPELDVRFFNHPHAALEYLQENNVDVLFLDVDMPGMSGLEFRKKVLETPVCIFTTDHPEYALESFELETLDYLIKPYSQERFSQTIQRIKEYLSVKEKAHLYEVEQENNFFFVKEGYQQTKVFINDILYLQALQNYTSVITPSEKHYILSTLGNLLSEANFKDFVRIHKSFAVQKKSIQGVTSKDIVLINDVRIPVGRSYKENLTKLIK